MSVETIAAYRVAAAKLGAALADTPNQPHPIQALANTLASIGIGLQGEEIPALWPNEPGWIWMAEAAQLRLMAEAEILEQHNDDIYPRYVWLGDIVRAWREGVKSA